MKVSIRTKILLAFGLNLVLLLGLGFSSIIQMREMNRRGVSLAESIVPALHGAADMQHAITRYRGLLAAHIAATEPSERTLIERQMHELEATLNTLFENYGSSILASNDRTTFGELRARWAMLLSQAQQAVRADTAGNSDANMFALYSALQPPFDSLEQNTHQLIMLHQARAADADRAVILAYITARYWMIGITVVAAITAMSLGLGLATLIARNLRRLTSATTAVTQGDLQREVRVQTRDELGLLGTAFNHMVKSLRTSQAAEAESREREAALLQAESQGRQVLEQTVAEYLEFVEQVAQGDLTQRLAVQQAGALGQLGNGLNTMVESLHSITLQVQQANSNIATAAAEILAATTQQVASAAEQSAAIRQTTATIEEVKAIALQTAQQASQVATEGQAMLEAARQGTLAVEESVNGMGQIRLRVESIAQTIMSLAEQTQAISLIITTVSELSDQSNLLALNAAIEAARAGEHGKSFAVVALHVRELAERSKQATGQVRDILGQIQRASNTAVLVTEEGTKGVEVGARLTVQAGSVINRIAGEVENGAQANIQIAAAAQQQTAGMDQIGQAMLAIQQATTQALASTRQAERAAQDLHMLAQSLQRATMLYRL